MARIKIDDIKKAAIEQNWEVISEEYKNLDTVMEFKCSEGHQVFLPYKKVRNKWECPICKENIYFNFTDETLPKKKNIQRTLGVDQATHISGFAIFDGEELINAGCFTAKEEDEIARDIQVKNWLIQLIQNWNVDVVGLEDIQLQQVNRGIGVTTYRTLARLQGILMAVCHELGVSYVVCPPSTWRAHCKVTGRSRADKKKSMQLKIKEWFDITVSDDVADAIGIGKYVSETHRKKVKIYNWE